MMKQRESRSSAGQKLSSVTVMGGNPDGACKAATMDYAEKKTNPRKSNLS